MDTQTYVIIAVIWMIAVISWMIIVMNNIIKTKRYQYMQVLMMKSLVEKQGEKVDLNILYQQALHS
jgi:hypothetical protein